MNFTQLLSQHLGLDKKPQDQKLADLQANLFRPTQKQLKSRMQRIRDRAKSGFKRVFSEQQLQSNVFYQAANISSNSQVTTLYQDYKRLSLPITSKSGFEQHLAMTKLYVVLLKLNSNKTSKNSAILPPNEDDIAIWKSLIEDSNLSKKEHDQLQNCALKIYTRQTKIAQTYKSQDSTSMKAQILKDKRCSPQQVLKSLDFEHIKKTLTTQWLLKPAQEEEQLPPLENPIHEQKQDKKAPDQQQRRIEAEDKVQEKQQQQQIEYIDVSQMDPDKVNWFKHIVDHSIPKNSNLHNPSMLAFLLERLVSNKSDEQLQGELIDLMGDENFDLLFQLFERRQYIRKLIRRISDVMISKRQKQGGMHNQAQVGVSVTYATVKGKKRNQKKKRENDKRGDINNLDLLIQLGFPKDFVYENNKLGLKKHQNKMNQNLQPDDEDQEQKEDFMQQYGMFGTQQSILPVKKQLGVQIVSDNYNYKHYKIQAVPRKNFPEQTCLLIEESFPEWARPTFSSSKVKRLNPIQSEVYQTAFKSNSNMLVCAPTGAGKTNIALMTVLRQISHFTSIQSSMLSSSSLSFKQPNYNLSHHTFTLIYVAPMKALVSQIVDKFTKALSYLHLKIRECTGDMQLSRAQIAETHLIVTTPEKWDVISRKSQNAMSQVRLIIMDEIHLLNQDRGSVLECLVARAMRTSEHTQLPIRLVGLSATLPNYKDVAKFMMAQESATFFFDNSYRPTPLQYEFYGLKNTNNSQRQRNLQTDITYKIATKAIYAGKQVLVFVHTRNQTIKTSEDLIQKMQTEGSQTLFVGDNAWQYE